MYATYNEAISVVAERFIGTLKKQNLQAHDSYFKKYLF